MFKTFIEILVLMVCGAALGCADRRPPIIAAPYSENVKLTSSRDDVSACYPVGNIDGKDIRRTWQDVRRDTYGMAQLKNRAVGLGGNVIFDTSGQGQGIFIVYRCNQVSVNVQRDRLTHLRADRDG